MTRTALLRAGAAAGPLFVTAFLLDGATRPHYDPLRHPVSSLSLGPRGWRQVANFAVTGALYLAGAVGLGRRGVIVGAAAVGLLGAGAFRTDPISGYPPGSPPVAEQKTPTGAAHDAFGVPVFLGIPAAAFVEARRAGREGRRGWALASAASGVGMLAFFGLAGAGFAQQAALVGRAGLLQRISLGIGFGWLTALMLRALRR